jgi:hypothetical protein
LFGPAPPGFSGARLEAFIADLAEIGREKAIPVIAALRGLDNRCPEHAARAEALRKTIAQRFEAAGLGFRDVDAAVREGLDPGKPVGALLGFGARIGNGHLNEDGHRAYARVVVDVIAPRADRR